MSGREECNGCDFYDPYPASYKCEAYEGQDVETITYCTHRTRKGKKINWGTNPLIMERVLRWNEVMFNGEIRGRHNDFYNPNGIIIWGDDGRMEDPVTGTVQLKDGTILTRQEYFETTPLGKQMQDCIDRIKQKGMKK